MERKRPGGLGITDLQPFLRPLPGAQEGAQEWMGVTERMVDEVDESKRKNKVYDLRIEPSGRCLFEWRDTRAPGGFMVHTQHTTHTGLATRSTLESTSSSPKRS